MWEEEGFKLLSHIHDSVRNYEASFKVCSICQKSWDLKIWILARWHWVDFKPTLRGLQSDFKATQPFMRQLFFPLGEVGVGNEHAHSWHGPTWSQSTPDEYKATPGFNVFFRRLVAVEPSCVCVTGALQWVTMREVSQRLATPSEETP